jgi:hypothetical protein
VGRRAIQPAVQEAACGPLAEPVPFDPASSVPGGERAPLREAHGTEEPESRAYGAAGATVLVDSTNSTVAGRAGIELQTGRAVLITMHSCSETPCEHGEIVVDRSDRPVRM